MAALFKPSGIPACAANQVRMTLDEFEAIRLADLEGLYHEQAAARMQVSRPTFSRIVDSAHRKLADALVHGKPLRIEGGPVVEDVRRRCTVCAAAWDGSGGKCPRCRRGAGRRCS